MFDANAAGVAIGELFFAEVHGTNEQLEGLGVSKGDIILCKHLKKSGLGLRKMDHTQIWLTNASDPHDYYDSQDTKLQSSLVYSGCPNGEEFICKEWREKALAFLGGSWHQ